MVTVAYQSGAFLQRCLDALAAQDFEDFEAVVVDNASTDGSIEALRLPDDRFRVEPMGANLGFAAANNVAARTSTAEWLVMLNPDTEAAPTWLSSLLAAAERWPGAASFGSTQVAVLIRGTPFTCGLETLSLDSLRKSSARSLSVKPVPTLPA